MFLGKKRMEHNKFMRRAIELAYEGLGAVNPNPLVGAVVVKENQIITEGCHERYGAWHAERNALTRCDQQVQGATMYVTLEPCCHYGKTPPCTDIIIQHGIAKVYVGILDPNPLVAGQGVDKLRQAGIEVEIGLMADEIRYMNRVFLKYITKGLPWVTLKYAMTIDGKIATHSGHSKWITNQEARQRVHQLRREYIAIMVGIGTVLADDPMLDCRLDTPGRQPIRIVVDSKARIPVDSKLVQTAGQLPTIVVHTAQADPQRVHSLVRHQIECIECSDQNGEVDIQEMLRILGKRKIDAILLEGGGTLNYAFIKHNLVDQLYAFIAPKIIGGKEAKTPVEGLGVSHMNEAIELQNTTIEQIGKDILISGIIKQ